MRRGHGRVMEQPVTAKITMPCPECGLPLVVRRNSLNDSEFLGCLGYPECRHTEGLPEHLKLRAAGAVALPGFE